MKKNPIYPSASYGVGIMNEHKNIPQNIFKTDVFSSTVQIDCVFHWIVAVIGERWKWKEVTCILISLDAKDRLIESVGWAAWHEDNSRFEQQNKTHQLRQVSLPVLPKILWLQLLPCLWLWQSQSQLQQIPSPVTTLLPFHRIDFMTTEQTLSADKGHEMQLKTEKIGGEP